MHGEILQGLTVTRCPRHGILKVQLDHLTFELALKIQNGDQTRYENIINSSLMMWQRRHRVSYSKRYYLAIARASLGTANQVERGMRYHCVKVARCARDPDEAFICAK